MINVVKVKEIKYAVFFEGTMYSFETKQEFKEWCRQLIYSGKTFAHLIDDFEPDNTI